jgi:hypothetical protein
MSQLIDEDCWVTAAAEGSQATHSPQQRNSSQYSKHVLPSFYKHTHLPKKLLLHEHNATTLQNLAHLVKVQNDSIIAGNIKMQKLALIKDSCC